MPYKRIGREIWHKKNGRWSIKQVCKSADNAKRALKLLNYLARE